MSDSAPAGKSPSSRVLPVAAAALASLAILRLAYAGVAARHAPPVAPPRLAPGFRAPPPPPQLPALGGIAVKYLNASQTAGPYPPDFSCFDASGGALSCSPAWCNATQAIRGAANVGSCVAAAPAPQNYTKLVSSIGCAACAAANSADARCSAAALAALFSPYPSIFAAYCNAGYLVMLTSTAGPASLSLLDLVPNPPGGTNGSNSAACKTRAASATPAWKVNAFPLSPVLYPASALTNNAGVYTGEVNGAGGPLNNGTTTFWLPASGRVGVTLSGQELYPVFNNRALFTNENCETAACNEHIGQGLGQPHLHGDPFGAQCLYSSANYTNSAGAVDWAVHPPLIGIADDGLWIYGRYLSSAAPGGATALDLCGGHAHGSYGYHYHTQVIAALSSGQGSGTSTAGLPYPQTTTGPLLCFRGNLSANANYLSPGAAATKPCCGTTATYVAAGYTLAGLTGAASNKVVIALSPAAAVAGGSRRRLQPLLAPSDESQALVLFGQALRASLAAAAAVDYGDVIVTALNTTGAAAGYNGARSVDSDDPMNGPALVLPSGALPAGAAVGGSMTVTLTIVTRQSASTLALATLVGSSSFLSATALNAYAAAAGVSTSSVAYSLASVNGGGGAAQAAASASALSASQQLGLGLGIGLGLAAVGAFAVAIFALQARHNAAEAAAAAAEAKAKVLAAEPRA